jgi:hypothetical protein
MLDYDDDSDEDRAATRKDRISERTRFYDEKQRQLGFAGVGWISLSLAALLAYAKELGPSTVVLLVLYVGFVIVIASITSAISGRWNDAFYWSALFALIAFLAIAGAVMINRSVAIAWGAVGACCGSFVGAKIPKATLSGSILSGLLGGVSMVLVLLALQESITMMIWFDIAFAFVVGGMLRPLADVLRWAEGRSGQHRVVLASWLTVCVLIGNALVPLLSGTVR